MNNEKKHIIYGAKDIQRYLSGNMSNEEMHAMEKAALDDPLLSDAIDGYDSVDNKEWNKVLSELSEKIAIAENTPIISISKNSFARRWRVAAAVLLVGSSIAIAYFFTAKENAATEQIASKTAAKKNMDTAINQTAAIDSTLLIAANSSADTNSKKELLVAAIDTRKPAKDNTASATFKHDNPPTKDPFVYQPGKPSATASKVIAETDNNKYLTEKAGKEAITSNKEVLNTTRNVANEVSAADSKKANDNIASLAAPTNEQNGLQFKASNFFNAQVVDAANHPLAFAQIKTTTQKPIFADAKGNFTMVATDTSVAVTVTVAGYLPKKYQLQNDGIPQIIRLEEDKTDLQELTYTKKKSTAPKTTLIKDDNIQALEEEENDGIEPINGWADYNNYLSQNITKSEQLKNSNIHGVVEMLVKLKANGNVSAVKIDKSLCAECDAEAIRLVKKGPKWDVKKNKGGEAKVKVRF